MGKRIDTPRQCWNCKHARTTETSYEVVSCSKFPTKHVYDNKWGCSAHAYNPAAVQDHTGDPELDEETEMTRNEMRLHRNRISEQVRRKRDIHLTEDEREWDSE